MTGQIRKKFFTGVYYPSSVLPQQVELFRQRQSILPEQPVIISRQSYNRRTHTAQTVCSRGMRKKTMATVHHLKLRSFTGYWVLWRDTFFLPIFFFLARFHPCCLVMKDQLPHHTTSTEKRVPSSLYTHFSTDRLLVTIRETDATVLAVVVTQ